MLNGKLTFNNIQTVITTPYKAPIILASLTVLFFCGIGISFAGPSLDLTVNNSTPSPGETITFTANVTGTDVHTILTDNSKINIEQEHDLPPYTWNLQIPAKAAGTKEFHLLAIIDGETINSNSLKVTVVPPANDLQSIGFQPGQPIYMSPGSKIQLHVTGYFSDNSRNLTEGAVGTLYSENIVDGMIVTLGDSPSIIVTVDGMLTAKDPGIAEVVATNNGKTATLRVFVEGVSAEDADGDALNDTEEDIIGTDKYNSDTDGDNCKDGIEVGSDPILPKDANKDGIIDALDNKTLVVQDEAGKAVSIRTSSGKISSAYSQKTDSLAERAGVLGAMQMDRGVFGFTVSDLVPGERIDVTLYFESFPSGTNTYLKYGPQLPSTSSATQWYEFKNITINGSNIILHLTDNGLGDSNLTSGVISDPGGPATKTISLKGDITKDGIIDRNDVNIINSNRNQKASVCPDCDIDGDGTITILDARKIMTMCTYPSCASN
jgi:hypothetical protein